MEKIIVVEPHKNPVVKEYESFKYEDMTELVGGYIEAIYPFDDPVAIVCNEEGKITGLELNRALRDEDGDIYDIIAGTFFICGCGEEDFCGLDAPLIQKYVARFMTPEIFLRVNGNIMVIPEI